MDHDTRVLYDSPVVHAALEASGRLRIRRGGSTGTTVCNIAAERVITVAAQTLEDGGVWLALHGVMDRVDFARKNGDTGFVGPFPREETEGLARALTSGLGLPRKPEVVTEESLRNEPERWHERRITVEGDWHSGRDVSDFAGAWVYPPAGVAPHEGTRRGWLHGFFRCTGSRDFDGRRDGHGPLGLSPAEFEAYEFFVQK